MAPTPKRRTPKHKAKADKAKRFTKDDPIIQQYITVPFEAENPQVVHLMTNITNKGMTAKFFLGPKGIPGLGKAVRAAGRVEEFHLWFNNTKHNAKRNSNKKLAAELAAADDDLPAAEVVTPKTAKKRAKGQKESLKALTKMINIVDFNSKSNRKKQREDSKTMKANAGVAAKNEANTAKLLEISKPIIAAGAKGDIELSPSSGGSPSDGSNLTGQSSPSDGSNLTGNSSPSDGSNLTGSITSPSSFSSPEPSPTAAALVSSPDYVYKTPAGKPAAKPAAKFDELFGDEEYEGDSGDEGDDEVEAGPGLLGRALNAFKSPFTASKKVRFDGSDEDDEFHDADDGVDLDADLGADLGADLDAALDVEESEESLVEEEEDPAPPPVVTRTTRSRAAKVKAGVAKGAKAVKKALTPPKLRKAKAKAKPKTKKCATAKQFQKQEKQFKQHLGWKKAAEVEARAMNNIFHADELLVEIAELEEQYNDFLEQHSDF